MKARRARIAVGSLVGYLTPWVLLGPVMLSQQPHLWLVFGVGLAFFTALSVLALLGKFDDPASPYVRGIKIVAIGALAAGALFLAYTFLRG